ncbi:N-acetylglucosamine-1-phosphate uridyltransferase / Glucosamine-1-phosphate N-acetyltransferase [hydrothermal vent metagenome]|uniref:N-acetylglucosamine-1-phosphate uridyltransferase / Glucosamine-1-phosphate N-acetyltransferase n=1 Tax=hydrothermal vent metagenome TaxID=652676 RepID=A0A3B1A2B1_9ZZZZ
MSNVSVIILAAGQGSRMKSALPKVLHPIAGKALVQHVIDTSYQLNAKKIIGVYGHGGDIVPKTINDNNVTWVAQAEQLGTGHAVDQAMPEVSDADIALVLYGDVPLTKTDTLVQLIAMAENDFALLTVHLDDPSGYGRIVRNAHGIVERIVEHKDSSDEEKLISEINTGILAVNAGKLRAWLKQLDNSNAQGEYYLTDIIAMAVADGMTVKTVNPETEEEVLGVNSRTQLAELEGFYQLNNAQSLMEQGVTIIDPTRLDIRGNVTVGKDVTLDINVILEGDVTIGDNVSIGANCVVKDSVIERGVVMQPMCCVEQAHIGADSKVGPFARIRPGTKLAEQTHIGNFVEIKNSNVNKGSKINHLSYIGDTDMGAGVNIGAGTITCNYDGANKHRTEIGDNVFVGSSTQLIAPLKVGDGATIGAGSTITKDTPENELTLTRAKQTSIKGWQRPTKDKK